MRLNNAKKIAACKGIKIKEIIAATGLSKSYIYDVLNQKSSPSIAVAYKISKVLGTKIQDVFPDT